MAKIEDYGYDVIKDKNGYVAVPKKGVKVNMACGKNEDELYLNLIKALHRTTIEQFGEIIRENNVVVDYDNMVVCYKDKRVKFKNIPELCYAIKDVEKAEIEDDVKISLLSEYGWAKKGHAYVAKDKKLSIKEINKMSAGQLFDQVSQ